MRILNIAHRGYSAKFPENTLLAFDEAIKAGCDLIEFDVQMTRDGHLVILHDNKLDRLTGQSLSTQKLSLEEVKRLKVFEQEPIPTLQEVLQNFGNFPMNIEVKPSTRDSVVADRLIKELRRNKSRSEVYITSRSLDFIHCHQIIDWNKEYGSVGFVSRPHAFEHLPTIINQFQLDLCNVHPDYLKEPFPFELTVIPQLWVWGFESPRKWERAINHPIPLTGLVVTDPAAFKYFLDNRRSGREFSISA